VTNPDRFPLGTAALNRNATGVAISNVIFMSVW
jgi:hypothetical protein